MKRKMLKLIKNKLFIRVFLFITILLSIAFILNLKVSYHQGINYEYKFIKIPLYLKIIDFFSRHYHYHELTKEIIRSCKTEEEKVFRLFNWTHENIRHVPEGFPIIDDHVWNIIIRGYGADDQFHDVFTTLCNYVKIKAFFTWVASKKENKKISLSFVKFQEKWFVFDPFYGVYFKNNKGGLVDIESIKAGNYSVAGHTDIAKIDYSNYIDNLPSIKNIGLRRANTKSPLNRLLLEMKKWKNNIKGE